MSDKKNQIGFRMKSYYEDRQRDYLLRRIPVIMRLDGKAFHTYTKGLNRQSESFSDVMNLTAIKLCEEIQGAKIAYVQSDEITILITDYEQLETEAWFDYDKSKMESVSASIAGVTFSLESYRIWKEANNKDDDDKNDIQKIIEQVSVFQNKAEFQRPAYFDSRARNFPKEEVCNNFIWRQQDAVRNSIQSLAQTHFSHKELHGKNCSQLQDMCFKEKGINWNNLPTHVRRGRCIIKVEYLVPGTLTPRNKWVVDNNIPIFTQDRNYIERYL